MRYRLGRSHRDTVYQQLGDQPSNTDPRVALFMGETAVALAADFVAVMSERLTVTAVREPEPVAMVALANDREQILDGVLAEPAAEPQPESDLLDLVRQYGDQRERFVTCVGCDTLDESRAHERQAATLLAQIGSAVRRLRDERDEAGAKVERARHDRDYAVHVCDQIRQQRDDVAQQRNEARAERDAWIEQHRKRGVEIEELKASAHSFRVERDEALAEVERCQRLLKTQAENFAAAAPGRTEQARDGDRFLWQHRCGEISYALGRPAGWCPNCSANGPWRPLLVATDAPQQDAEPEDQHGLPRPLDMMLNDLMDEAYSDGGLDEGFSSDTRDLRDEILQRWPIMPRTDAPQQDGPIVLTLPEVPEGAVALRLSAVLDREHQHGERLIVELASPREPRGEVDVEVRS